MPITRAITALLPMKGYSERVPNKNMRMFAGRPLYHCIAGTLENSDYIKTIIINTDSDVIAADARDNFSKVVIHSRPEAICGDFVPMNAIIAHDLQKADGEHFIQTHCTNPCLTKPTLERAIEQYFALLNTYDSLFSVTKLQTRLYWDANRPINHNPRELLRTQDLPPVYEENSNIYIFSASSFRNAGKQRIGLKAQLFEVDKLEAIDIDDEADFQVAEMHYTAVCKRHS
jgi:CMP-N-acetylneuraminic acid synthetase